MKAVLGLVVALILLVSGAAMVLLFGPNPENRDGDRRLAWSGVICIGAGGGILLWLLMKGGIG